MRVVVDTHVVVSALLTRSGPSQWIVDQVLLGAIALLVDNRILTEYREVLTRSKFSFGPIVGGLMADRLDSLGVRVATAPWQGVLPDAGDLPFIEVARAGNAQILVTGNQRHFPVDVLAPCEVLSPAQTVARLRAVGVV
ncbi:MAG: putative toxin-antitoxin system toxin component, PIN family [Deltaproteobacteria bacterium]|nr:putative toxin-antitoxin system toxin component, PIN family [Deltaproteobacteria bacterium]